MNGGLPDRAASGDLILSKIHSEPQTQNVSDFSHRQPFLGQMVPSTFQWNQPMPAVVQRRFSKMKFFLEFHSGHVNKHSGSGQNSIRFSPESLFTSSRNPYSHHPGIVIHMPRNTQYFVYSRVNGWRSWLPTLCDRLCITAGF
jgi:hypothetical protein